VSGQLHAPDRFTSRERALGTHWIGAWVGLRAGLDAYVMVKNFKIIFWRDRGRGESGRDVNCISVCSY